jgi:hypothetical protein
MRWALALGLVAAFAGSARAGGTFEIGFGGGILTNRINGKNDTAAAYSSPTIAAGARLDEKTWLLGRISLLFTNDLGFAFIGGSLQYFPTDRFFVAGGIGGGVETAVNQSIPGTNTNGYGGFAADLRAGVNLFPEYRHTVLLQLELTPTIYKDTQSVGAMLLASYQYL